MSIEENLKKYNLKLPEAKDPVGSYIASKIVNKFLFISGQISVDASGKLIKGKVVKDLTIEEGYEAAKMCALSILSQAKKNLKDLEKIKGCVKLVGFVNSENNFTEQPKVINGASETIANAIGEKGKHTRAAVSVNSLPLGVAVEVDAIFELN